MKSRSAIPNPIDFVNLAPIEEEEEQNSWLLVASLWLFTSIFSASYIEFSANVTGVSVSFSISDVVLVGLLSWLLHNGIVKICHDIQKRFREYLLTSSNDSNANESQLLPNVSAENCIFNNKEQTFRNIIMTLPWVFVSMHALWANNYCNLSDMVVMLKKVKHATAVPWAALSVTALAIVLKLVLLIRILQLAVNLWYRKRLEKELYGALR